MSELDKVYIIRDVQSDDKAFIMATWLRGLYYGDSWFSLMPKDIFMSNYKHILEAMLAKHEVKIACLKDDPTVIIGYSVLSKEEPTIHWCFVKQAFRHNGVARSLIPQSPTSVTHLTTLGKSLMHKFPECIFNPFAV